MGGALGALRISAGARVVSESWNDDVLVARENLRGEFDQVRAIVEKLALLVRYYDADRACLYGRPSPNHITV